MQRYYLDVKRFVETDPRYAAFLGYIEGANYPPSPVAVVASQLASGVWILGILLLIGGEGVFSALGMREPEWFVSMKNNKAASFGLLFVINNIGNSMLSTGAFEIYINDELVFSKLALKRLPNAQDLTNILAMAGYK